MREGGGQRTSLAQGIVQTPSAVADLIFQEENSGEGTFLRMPMLEVGGITWLKNLDEFLGRCFLAIKAKEVLAIGVTDESSMFYVCCAALLAPPAEEPGAVSSPMFRSQSDPLDDAVLEKFIGQLGGAPGLRAKAVVDDALSYLFGGDTYVRAISDLKSAAEAARSQKQVRDNILAAYQRLERYCWLIALASFVMGTNLAGISVMPSFASWVTSKKNASVLKALEEVDLWVAEPRKCPDPCHSVYSSVWKRWETKSEAKQMI
jgi:hypothetical protein